MSPQIPRPGSGGDNQRGDTFNRLPGDFQMPSDRGALSDEGRAAWESVLMAHDLDQDIQADLAQYYKKCLQDDPLRHERLESYSTFLLGMTNELIEGSHGKYGELEAAVYSPALYYGEWPTERQKGIAATVAIFNRNEQAHFITTRTKLYRVEGEGRTVIEDIVGVKSDGQKHSFSHYSYFLAPRTLYAEVQKVQELADKYTRWYDEMELPFVLGRALDLIQDDLYTRFPEDEAPVVMPELIQEMTSSRSVEDPFYVTIHDQTYAVNVMSGKNNKVLVSVEISSK